MLSEISSGKVRDFFSVWRVVTLLVVGLLWVLCALVV